MTRAYELALTVREAARGVESIEALAMATAATGNFEEAIKLQGEALALLGAGSDFAALDAYTQHLEENLGRYQAQQPAIQAWPDFVISGMRDS